LTSLFSITMSALTLMTILNDDTMDLYFKFIKFTNKKIKLNSQTREHELINLKK